MLGGYKNIKPGRVLIDGKLYHKDASTEQFIWNTRSYCTKKLMGNIVKFGYDFDGWNMEADGTVTDYDPGQETNLTEPLPLCGV